MSLIGMKKIECPKNQWTTVISSLGTGLPADWNIRFKAQNGEPIEGSYIEKKWWWMFPQQPVTGRITEHMKFERDWINYFYSLRICPDIDVIAEID